MPEKSARFGLDVVSTDMSCLVLEVQDEPKFDAWIRDRESDAIVFGSLDSLGNVWVLVNVEHAPDLVMGAAPASLRFSKFEFPCLDCPIHELQGPSMEWIHPHKNVVSMLTSPVNEVPTFSLGALGEH